MKFTIIFLVLLNFVVQKNYAQDSLVVNKDETFYLQKIYQEEIDGLQKVGYFNIENELLNIDNLFDSKSDVIDYVNLLLKIKYPKTKITGIRIGEDKTKKIWFVHVSVDSAYGHYIRIMISKKNGKIISFGKGF